MAWHSSKFADVSDDEGDDEGNPDPTMLWWVKYGSEIKGVY